MSAHAQLSPSKRHRWAVCPGSIREEAKYPDSGSGPAAIDGTHTHTLLEKCIDEARSNASELIGKTLTDHEGTFVVDVERAARVQVVLDYVDERIAEFGADKCVVMSESKVDPSWLMGRDDLGGTVDVQIRGPGVLEIIDLKDGMVEVPAEDNPQLEQYAIGVLSECRLAWNTPYKYPWQTIRMTIVQPKLALRGRSPVMTWIVPIGTLLSRLETLSSQARATDAPDAPLVPGEKQCKYCRAKGACAALASDVMKEVGVMFQPVVETASNDIVQQSANKDPTTMSDEQLRQVLDAAPLMRQLLDGVEKEVQRRLEAGQAVPGYKLVHGRGSRAWNLSDENMVEKLLGMGIPKGSLYVEKLITPAQAEKLTWTKRDGTAHSLSDRQKKSMNQEYVSTLAGKLTVVPESDSRPAVTVNAAPLFAPVEVTETLPSWLM